MKKKQKTFTVLYGVNNSKSKTFTIKEQADRYAEVMGGTVK